MIRTVIADAEPLARQRLRHLLHEEGGFDLVAECSGGAETVSAIAAHDPDLVFLEVRMPEMDAFEVIERAGIDPTRSIVFVTAHDAYASRAFDVQAVDYLLKPVSRERFREAAERARRRVASSRRALASDPPAAPRYAERLLVRHAGRIVVVATREIEWVEGAGNYLQLHCGGGATYLLRQTMGSFEARLDPHRFLRIHRSSIVRTDRVAALETRDAGGYVVVLKDATRLAMSPRYRTAIARLLGDPGAEGESTH